MSYDGIEIKCDSVDLFDFSKIHIICDEVEYIIDDYDKYLSDVVYTNKITNGDINLFRHNSIISCAMNYFNHFNNNKHCRKFENIERHEAEIVDGSYRGGIIFGTKKKLNNDGTPVIYNNCSKFDVNSFYPSLFLDKSLRIPFRCGKISNVDSIFNSNGKISYGTYLLKITGKNKFLNKTKLDQNNIGWFTHIDIIDIITLKLKIELITDCEYNSIIYNDDDLIQVSEIFAEPMQKL